MKYIRFRYIRWAILALLLIGVWMFRWIPGAGEWYAREVYPGLSVCLSGVASVVPFSLCEVTVIGIGGFLLVYPFVARRKKRSGWHILGREVEVLVWVYVWFYWGWGMNYFRNDFFSRSGVARVSYEEARFHRFLEAYTDSLNATYGVQMSLSETGMQNEVKRIYRHVPERFGLTVPKDFQHPKRSLVNGLYSKVGVLGYMGPFFDESHVNHELLPAQYPFTYAHELSHLLGVSQEAEANFWAYQVCVRSANRYVRYCGYFGLLPYIYRDAYRILGEAGCKEWANHIRPDIMRELRAKEIYWGERYSPWIGAVQDAVYNWYLKGNRIPSGTKNYGEVTGMILSLPENWWQ